MYGGGNPDTYELEGEKGDHRNNEYRVVRPDTFYPGQKKEVEIDENQAFEMEAKGINPTDVPKFAGDPDAEEDYDDNREKQQWDDWKDEHSLPMKTMACMMRKNYDEIASRYPRQVKAVETYVEELHKCEKQKVDNIDLVAGFTGTMLGELFDWKQDEWSSELKTLGFYMGKFVYLMDAYEDLEKDEKKNAYNPLLKLKKQNGNDYECLCRLMLTSIMSECAKSFERLPILLHADIIRNVLYSGVWSKYEYIQLKKKKRKKK